MPERYKKYKNIEERMMVMGKFFREYFRKSMVLNGSMHNADFSLLDFKGISGFLDIEQHYTMSDLARNAHMSLPNMTSIITRLAKKGMVKRRRDTKDRRVVHVFLTEKGKKLVYEFMQKRGQELEKSIGRLSEKDRQELFQALDRAQTILQKINYE